MKLLNFNLHDRSFIEERDAQQLQRIVLQTLEQGARRELMRKAESPGSLEMNEIAQALARQA